MQEMLFTIGVTYDGTLGADKAFYWTLPIGATLIHVSAVQSNAGAATLAIGDSGNTTQAIAAYAIGVSGTPVEKATADFTSPHFVDGDVFVLTLDYNGAAGTAAHDVNIVCTFLAG